MAGMAISLTAVQEWLGDEELRKTVTQEVLSGKKYVQNNSQSILSANVAVEKCVSLSPKHLQAQMLLVSERPQNSQKMGSTSSFRAQRNGLPTACSAIISSPPVRRRKDSPSSLFLAAKLSRPNSSRHRIQRQLQPHISNSTRRRSRSRTCSERKDKASKLSCQTLTTYVVHYPSSLATQQY